ncbi:xanthine transmembrane transporter [Aureococcus anophagefferens]|uniref:Xanthine transmembrane transporter n=1 Tax=Aureococcus anophagefferens TaxID=44056 RepID=A0ABR1G7W8_AURAN
MSEEYEKEPVKAVSMPEMDETGAGCNVCMPPGGIVGADKYDYKYLCVPSMPWSKGAPRRRQHALAMVAGIATSGGLLIAGDACFPWQRDSAMCEAREYMISAAWITPGILTIIQVFRARILGTGFYLGTGLISVMGTSFTFLPIAREMVIREIRDASARASPQRLFPPVATGCAVMLIGVSLISSGIKYVGGGVFCGENDFSRSAAFGSPQYCNERNVILPLGGRVPGASRYEAVAGDMTFDFHTSNGRVQANMVAAVPGRKYKYFNDYRIRNAVVHALWDITPPLGFSKEYFLPIVIGFFVSTAETIGDVTNTCFYSRLPTEGADFDSSRARAPAFYGGNLRHNIGFWPRHKTCDVFPSVTTTNTVTPASCDLDGCAWTPGGEAFERARRDLGGVYAAAVTEDVTETVKTCTNNNGFCCLEYDDTKGREPDDDDHPPQGDLRIGFLAAALFLHIILPEDAVDPDDPYSLALAGHPE